MKPQPSLQRRRGTLLQKRTNCFLQTKSNNPRDARQAFKLKQLGSSISNLKDASVKLTINEVHSRGVTKEKVGTGIQKDKELVILLERNVESHKDLQGRSIENVPLECDNIEYFEKADKEPVILLERQSVESLVEELHFRNKENVSQKNNAKLFENVGIQKRKKEPVIFLERKNVESLVEVLHARNEENASHHCDNVDLFEKVGIKESKKEIVIFLQRGNVESSVKVVLARNNENASRQYKNVEICKQTDLNELETKFYFDPYDTVNSEIESTYSSSENQSMINGLRISPYEDERGSCENDETVSNSDAESDSNTYRSQELGASDVFWYRSPVPLPILKNANRSKSCSTSIERKVEAVFNRNEIAEPLITDVRALSNSSSATLDLELTPPSSAISGSTVCSSDSDCEDSYAQDFCNLENLSQETDRDKAATCPDMKLCRTLTVNIVPIEPSLRQLQILYRRQKIAGLRKFRRQTQYRDNHLRPRNSLRQFLPFRFEIPQRSGCREKNPGNTSGTRSHRNDGKKRLSCQVELFGSCTKQLTRKMKALKLRNRYENALTSINQRIVRQNHFWKMLPT